MKLTIVSPILALAISYLLTPASAVASVHEHTVIHDSIHIPPDPSIMPKRTPSTIHSSVRGPYTRRAPDSMDDDHKIVAATTTTTMAVRLTDTGPTHLPVIPDDFPGLEINKEKLDVAEIRRYFDLRFQPKPPPTTLMKEVVGRGFGDVEDDKSTRIMEVVEESE